MRDMTQTALSEQSGVPQASISKYLLGQRLPGLRHLEALERALPELRSLRNAALAKPITTGASALKRPAEAAS